MVRTCKACGSGFEITPAERETLEAIGVRAGWRTVRLPNRCTACRQSARAEATRATPGPDLQRTCVHCGDSFTVTTEQREAFAARGWNWPRRCERCLIAGYGAAAMR